ncbi:MAG TPA: hypothetical protein VGG27_17590 [Magnetospirillaceae bacterium]|jgi:hypothetical protein
MMAVANKEPIAGPGGLVPTDSLRGVASTNFNFEHRAFQAPGAVFRKDKADGHIAMHLMLGGVAASVEIGKLTRTFSIATQSPDGELLRSIDHALTLIPELRPGDSLPVELLDGTATWTLEQRHFDRARSKILLQLVKRVLWDVPAADAAVDVVDLIETPKIKNEIPTAIAAAARQIEMSESDMTFNAIPRFAGELAQIEALREKVARYAVIRKKLKALATIYRNDVRNTETIHRVSVLVLQPLNALRDLFRQLEQRTGEIMLCLQQLTPTVQYLRGVRDSLREFVLLWHDLDVAWLDLLVERSGAVDALVARTYRLAATHYSQSEAWQPTTNTGSRQSL